MPELDPQFSTVRVLKPFNGFEAAYQGKTCTTPIAFPGDLDLESGKPGYATGLLNMLPVPIGSRVLLWIPLCFTDDLEDPDPTRVYTYQIFWRIRNTQEYVDSVLAKLPPAEQKLYSFEKKLLGVPNPSGDPRVLVPCAMETIAYEQTEPGTNFANGALNLRGNQINPDGAVLQDLPVLAPNGALAGQFSQGTFGIIAGELGVPTYMTYETMAAGNEMSIIARRAVIGGGDRWDFTSNANDKPFSNTYGTNNGTHANVPGTGIFVITGSG
jgi:hypothetical protein